MKPFFNIKFRRGPRESSEQVSLWVDLPRCAASQHAAAPTRAAGCGGTEGSGSDSDESSDESESEEEEEGGIDIDELLQKDDDVFEVENKRSCSNGGMRRGAGGSSL